MELRAHLSGLVAVVALLGASCSSGTLCTAGSRRTCSCAGGGSGTQVCAAGGGSYGACTSCYVVPPDAGRERGLPVGKEGGPCTWNRLCDPGLVCASRIEICVRADGGADLVKPDLVKPDRLLAKLDQPPKTDQSKTDQAAPAPCPGNALFNGLVTKGSSATATSGTQVLTIKLKALDTGTPPQTVLTDWTNPQKTVTDVIMNLGQDYPDGGGTGFHAKVTQIITAPESARFCISPP